MRLSAASTVWVITVAAVTKQQREGAKDQAAQQRRPAGAQPEEGPLVLRVRQDGELVVHTHNPPAVQAASRPPEGEDSANLIKRYGVRSQPATGSRFLERMAAAVSARQGLAALLPLCLAVFALGFLHASLPGHGNAVLAS